MSVRIKLLRRQHGLSLEQLAQRSGLTKSYLSKVERGLCTPSISSALKLAQALAVDVAQLFGSPTDDSQLCITRAGDALRVSSAEPAGRVIELLASQISHKQMQPFVLTPPEDFADGPQLHGHPGEELVWVLSGEIEIAFPERTAQLACGDCAYFRAELPHRIRRLGDTPARVLVVIAQGEAESAKSG